MIPQYTSAGIWDVFQRRRHLSHSHVSPYGTGIAAPHVHVTVILAPFTPDDRIAGSG
jgi:hypothetical protein